MKPALYALLLSLSLTVAAQEVTVTDATINAGETYTMTADTTYILDGFVFVEDGAVLNIEPGTVIRGKQTPTTGDNASALIIARGGKIYASGTAASPIIFTAEADDLNNPNDLTWADRGLWGGLIVLGRATTNRGVEGQIEGIPSGEIRAAYGGDNDYDNSGVLRYISIRHGGAELGPGDEINGLTLGAVGSQTVVEFIEIYSNLDDGVEWFGGTVNTRYIVVAFCGDDGFDYDEGWRGKNQYWLAVQGPDNAGRVGEHDGGTVQETAMPYAKPYIYNATYIGPGVAATPEGDGSEAIYFRDNAGGAYVNSIITEYNGANDGKGITIEDIEGEDSRSRLENGDLKIVNNLWWQFGNGNTLEAIAPQDFVREHLAANNNQIVDPQLRGVSRIADGNLDPRPSAMGPAASGAATSDDNFFDKVPYYGAFNPHRALWTNGWTALSANGHTSNNEIVVTDASVNGDTVWSANNTYVLDGFVFVESGSTLTIEAGTVIKARQTPSTGDNASALIIARGAKIIADGTADAPIIFTSELDDLNDANDLTWQDRGLWGGVIVLGNATTNRGVEGQIEGIPSGELRAAYGGDNDRDNSGILRYISIRHGGAELGPGDEINGLTLGAVGSETVIDHIEIYSNLDDGFEWFGGTVNTSYLVAAFCGDDGFDYDEGWRGKNQFWFAVQGPDSAGRVGEHDGGTVQETAEPYATPHIYNATYIGPGVAATPEGDGSEAIYFRDNAGGAYVNSIITQYNGANDGKGITVEDIEGEDSRSRLENGDLKIANNIWWQFGNGNTLEAIAPQDFVRAHLAANGNRIVDPHLRGTSRNADGGLDPRPAAGSPAASGSVAPSDPFFRSVPYYGAFDPNGALWTDGWTAVWANGHTATGLDSQRWISHITSANGGFQTTVHLVNNDGAPSTVYLRPHAADGTALTMRSVTVPSNGVVSHLSSDLFGGEAVSHFWVTGSHNVTVTASYKVASGVGASADFNESAQAGTLFRIYQGEWAQVFDGLALVNIGNGPATVTVTQRAADGQVLGTATITESLSVGSKILSVFDSLFSENPGSTIEVESSEPCQPVFLRGTRVGVSPGYLYVTVPVRVR